MNAPKTVLLLDSYVLLALFWPHHRHHALAHAWFAGRKSGKWASCALTQAAFVRISMNPRVHGTHADYSDVIALLKQVTDRDDHVFWATLPSLTEMPLMSQLLVQGYKQITDAYLLALAQHHQGRLATLDSGVCTLLPTAAERKRWVELITP